MNRLNNDGSTSGALKTRRLILTTILLTIFLDFFNLGLIYPIFSSLIFEGNSLFASDVSEFHKNVFFGVLVAAFPFGQLFGAPIIGQLSDFYGRRKLLVFSLIGTVLTLFICSLAVFYSFAWLLFLGRFAGGLMAGNMALAYASLADFSSENDKTRNFALVPFTASAGFALGPFLSGILANQNAHTWAGPELPFLIAAFFSLINLGLVIKAFPRTFQKTEKKSVKSIFWGILNLWHVLRNPKIGVYLLVLFLMISANFLFVQFIGPHATEKFHIDVTGVGYLYTNVGLGAALGNLFLTRYLARHFSPEKALAGSLIALTILLITLVFSPNLIILHIISFLIMLACAIGYTNSMTMVSNLAAKDKQGEMMGIAVSIQNCSEFLPAFLVGFIAVFSENIPMLISAFCALCCYCILKTRRFSRCTCD